MFITSAYAQNLNETASSTDGMLMQLLPVALILVVFYLFVFRPMDKQKKSQDALLTTLKKGDEVVTSAGLIGKVAKLDESEITLELTEGVKVRVLRSTVTGLYGGSLPAKT